MFIEKLSETEINLIDKLRELGIETSDGDYYDATEPMVSCQDFLTYWEFAKQKQMSNLFKDSLILEKPVTVTLEDDDLYSTIRDRIIWDPTFENIMAAIYNKLAEYQDLSARVYPDNSRNFFNSFSITSELKFDLFSSEALVKNRYSGRSLELKVSENKVFKLTHGCKAMKAIGQLAKYAGVEEEFERIRILHSQVMNQANLSATLCLSIHPLDYMTASYNDNDWHSCMHWTEGDYRRGVIEMMNSPYVIVAYLKSKSKNLEFFMPQTGTIETWNSKRWREFFILSDVGIFGIKGYPFWNEDIEKITLKWIKELVDADDKIFSSKITEWQVDSKIVDASVNSNFSMSMECGPAMYNDFYDNNKYQAIVAKNLTEPVWLDYSGESECIACGKEYSDMDFDEAPSSLVCNNCVDGGRCYCYSCGEAIHEDEAIWINDVAYCEDCYNKLPTCDRCHVKYHDAPFTRTGLSFMIGSGDDETTLIKDPSNSSALVRHACRYCLNDISTLKEDELYENHVYASPAPSSFLIYPIVPLERISNLAALKIPQASIDKFINEIGEETFQKYKDLIA